MLWLVLSSKIIESPRYTLLEKHDRKQAESDLQKIRSGNVEDELKELQEGQSNEKSDVKQMSVAQLFTDKTVRWQLIIVAVSQMGQQLCGTYFLLSEVSKKYSFNFVPLFSIKMLFIQVSTPCFSTQIKFSKQLVLIIEPQL